MPRKKRDKKVFSTYYIFQKGPNDKLFNNKKEKEYFLNILKKTKAKYNFKLYAFCLNTNSYKLIIYDNGSDITKIMKSINVSFTMKINKLRGSKGSIFKTRFESKILYDGKELLDFSKNIHISNENSQFNSYCAYFELDDYDLVDSDIIINAIVGDNKKRKYKMFIHDNLELKEINCSYDFSKCDNKKCIKSLKEAKKKLNIEMLKENIDSNILFNNKKLRNTKIKEFRKKTTLTLNELGQLFGGLSESYICKIINKED